jgi:hypothetical protein
MVALAALTSCSRPPGDERQREADTKAVAGAVARPRAVLLLAQAQFIRREGANGEAAFEPGAAKLRVVAHVGDRWLDEVIEDPESNVFHGALPFHLPGEVPGILTIGGNLAPRPALLKIWRRTEQGWQGTLLAQATFGGVANRFRDVAIGDVDGDGKAEIVVATHDMGVVAVLRQPEQGANWKVSIIDKAPLTYVHEIEIGDVDGDGLNEIYATPSAPNRVSMADQPGKIVRYRFQDGRWTREVVDSFDDGHAKEILLADVENRGRPDLFAAVERSLTQRPAPGQHELEVRIQRYRFAGGGWQRRVIATLPDITCRFLNAGDVDADGRAEVVASCAKSGLWMLKPAEPEWTVRQIDDAAESVEYATTLADLDGDGVAEIYTAADRDRAVRRYVWNGRGFERSDLVRWNEEDLTFGLAACKDVSCAYPAK